MNNIVSILAMKDWQLHWKPLVGYLAIGLLSLLVLCIPDATAFHLGMVLLICSLIFVGVHLVVTTVINERKNQTLALIMSLPITIKEYTSAKLLVNLSVYTVAWLILFGGTMLVILGRDGIVNGLVPFAVITLLYLMTIYIAALAVAMISESEILATVAITAGNVLISPFLFAISNVPGIREYIGGAEPVWTGAAFAIIGTALALSVLIIALTYYIQSRKTDFL